MCIIAVIPLVYFTFINEAIREFKFTYLKYCSIFLLTNTDLHNYLAIYYLQKPPNASRKIFLIK
jgi:hypothetical protein